MPFPGCKHPKIDIVDQFMSETPVKGLTCCGLQKKQGEETADQVCTLHDGCQENSDCHTGYIYQGRKVKGRVDRGGGAQRGPASGGAGGLCALCLCCCRSHGMPQGHHEAWQLVLLWNEAAVQRWRPSGLQHLDPSADTNRFSLFIIWFKYVLITVSVQAPGAKRWPEADLWIEHKYYKQVLIVISVKKC